MTSRQNNIKRPTLSNIRRRVATMHWGSIQSAISHGRGVSFYSTAGHGGFVSTIPAGMSDEVLEAISDAVVEHVVMYPQRWLHRNGEIVKVTRWGMFTSDMFSTREDFVKARNEYLNKSEHAFSLSVLVGEEDCAWALVVAALDIAGAKVDWDKGFTYSRGRDQHIAEAIKNATSWHPKELHKLMAAVPKTPEGEAWKIMAIIHRDSVLEKSVRHSGSSPAEE